MINKLKHRYCELSATDTMINIAARQQEANRPAAETEFIHELTMIAVEKSLKRAGYKTNNIR